MTIVCLLAGNVSMAQTYPPSSVVTMPYSGAYYKAGTDIEIHVYATDIGKTANNGTVTKVEFFNGTTLLGEATTHNNNTYRFVWSCVPAGTYTIKARATNNRGVSFTSVGVIVTVGNQEVAQRGMSACKGKYLANLHQGGQLASNYTSLWNGVTAENACKWGSVEGTRGVFNWGGADAAYNSAINNQMMFRYHAAVWAAQYPNWLFNLTTAEARAEVIEYMQAIAQRFPRTDQLDVLNEQLFTHQKDNQRLRDLLSGKSNTAIDDFGWQIWLFEQARAIFPNTKLVLNDYGLEGNPNTINEMLKLTRVLRDRGLIDGFGTQAHWFNVDFVSATNLKSNVDLMATSGVPVYVTELDMNGRIEDEATNGQAQLDSYRTRFPVYWEHPAVKGITLWGYISNRTWVKGTGIVTESGADKPAMTWLQDYMNGRAKVGYPSCIGGPCSNGSPVVQFVSPSNNAVFASPGPVKLDVTAVDFNGSITNVRFYNGATLLNTDNTAPYSYDWTNVAPGTYEIRAVATDNEGNTGEAKITIRVNVPQSPYGGVAHKIPGTIQLEEYDLGGNGFAYYDDTPGSQVTPIVNFRMDEDVDIEACTDAGGGYNIGWATAGEWLEYTVNVEAAGTYDLELRVACDGAGRTVTVAMDGTAIASNVSIPNTSGWQSWQTVTVRDVELTTGRKVMRLTIGETDYVNLNYATFKAVDVSLPPVVTLTVPSNNASYGGDETVRLTATASDPDGVVSKVDFYVGDLLIGSVTSAPYSVDWSRMNPGSYVLTAVATDNKGISTTSSPVSVTIRAVQAPFHGVARMIPGRIEAEEYDLGGEGLGYHEANTNGNEGKSPFRNDEVDIEETGDDHGDYNVGYILSGEWLQYSVEVLSSGVYDLNLRMAADGAGKTLHVEMDGVDVTGPIQVPNTGGWQVWETVTVRDVNLTAGEHVMRIVFGSDYMNLNYVEFTDVVTGMNTSEMSAIQVYPVPFTDAGFTIKSPGSFNYRITDLSGSIVEIGKGSSELLTGQNLAPGVYMLSVDNNQRVTTRKIVKY